MAGLEQYIPKGVTIANENNDGQEIIEDWYRAGEQPNDAKILNTGGHITHECWCRDNKKTQTTLQLSFGE